MVRNQARFSIGQCVHHELFDYRGVIVDVDPVFQASDAWYEQVAKSRPPKDQPWYQVLVDGSDRETYVAERNLQADDSSEPIEHPRIPELFIGYRDGLYITRNTLN